MDGNIFNDCDNQVKEGHGNSNIKKERFAQRKKRKENPNLLLVSAVLWFCIICTCFIACLNM